MRSRLVMASVAALGLLIGCGSTVTVGAPPATAPSTSAGEANPGTAPASDPIPKPSPAPPPGMKNPAPQPSPIVPPTGSVPGLPAPISVAEATAVIGMSMADATGWAKQRGWSVRVSTLDGESQMVTADYSPTRINVSVTKAIISAVDSIG